MSEPLEGLRHRRRASDLTQQEMAKAIGVDSSHYSRIERGLIPLTIERAKILADLLGCRIDDLL